MLVRNIYSLLALAAISSGVRHHPDHPDLQKQAQQYVYYLNHFPGASYEQDSNVLHQAGGSSEVSNEGVDAATTDPAHHHEHHGAIAQPLRFGAPLHHFAHSLNVLPHQTLEPTLSQEPVYVQEAEQEAPHVKYATKHQASRYAEADGHAADDGPVDYYAHPKYQYEYKVDDPDTGDSKYQHETRDGDVVKGVYTVQEPDGSVRIVEYASDKENGFTATIRHAAPAQHHQELASHTKS